MRSRNAAIRALKKLEDENENDYSTSPHDRTFENWIDKLRDILHHRSHRQEKKVK